MHLGEQGHGRGIDTQRAWSKADRGEAARLEESQLEVVPAALGPDGEEDAPVTAGERVRDRRAPAGIGDESYARGKQNVEAILDEDLELPVD